MTTPTTFPVTACAAGDIGPGPARRLAAWRENVGQPIAIDRDLSAPPEPTPRDTASAAAPAFVVLSWNVWIGRGRLGDVVDRIRTGAYAAVGVTPDLPLVVLLQEAYRSDETVPARSNGWAPREVAARRRAQSDVVDLASRLGLSLRYAPSMRNGADRSDRGNAILSSLPFTDARALELPLLFQRRVPVTATLTIGGQAVRLVSAHLDPRGPPDHRWLGAAGRTRHAAELVRALDDDTVILGADLNLARGRREGAWRVLSEAGFTAGVPPVVPVWRHTYHALPRLVLDYVLARNRRGVIASLAVHRLDEHPSDRGATVFGSDHHPLLARVELT